MVNCSELGITNSITGCWNGEIFHLDLLVFEMRKGAPGNQSFASSPGKIKVRAEMQLPWPWEEFPKKIDQRRQMPRRSIGRAFLSTYFIFHKMLCLFYAHCPQVCLSLSEWESGIGRKKKVLEVIVVALQLTGPLS